MDIKDLAWNETQSKRFNNSMFPRSIRCLIVEKRNCGKTTLLLNFLLRTGWLDYDNLMVFGRRNQIDQLGVSGNGQISHCFRTVLLPICLVLISLLMF